MKPRICILLNDFNELNFVDSLRRYLPVDRFEVTITENFPPNPSDYRLIVPWNYRRVLPGVTGFGNVMVFHASDLPNGRGWAPIYHTLSSGQSDYVLSGILAAEEADKGDIVVQARFSIRPDYIASFLRQLDTELSLLLVAKVVERWSNKPIAGHPQHGAESSRGRRRPSDSEVDLDKSLRLLIPHLRGLESVHPGFFLYEGMKYLIEIRPEQPPCRPSQVYIYYPATGEREIWDGWA